MIGNKKTISKKPVKKYHKRCTLEVIAEEKEFENVTKESIGVVPKRGNISETAENSFTPFLSSWASRGVKNQKTIKSIDMASKGNLRQQYESLRSDYKELFELTRLEELNKHDILSTLEELEKECQNLRFEVDETKKKLTLERANAEQIKTDYEFMLETQNQTFKRREKELLEQIDKCAVKIDMQTSIENDLPISTMNAFEYEEISEKLESFEKQNEFLQISKYALELQNRELNDTLAEMKESFRSLELKHIELTRENKVNQPNLSSTANNSERQLNEKEGISYKQNSGFNRANDELFVEQEKLIEVTEDSEIVEKRCLPIEKQLPRKEKSGVQTEIIFACKTIPDANDFTTQQQSLPSDNDLMQVLINLQTAIQLRSENKKLSSKYYSGLGQMKHKTLINKVEDTLDTRKYAPKTVIAISNEFDNSNSDTDILNILQTCLAQVNAMYRYERNTESENELGIDSSDDLNTVTSGMKNDNNPLKQLGNNMNLSDSEKINKSNIFIESSEKSMAEDCDFIIQKLKPQHENDKKTYTELQEIYENTCTNLVRKNEEIQALIERNQHLLENIETLNKEKYSQRDEYEKVLKVLEEKDEMILTIGSEQMRIETEKENLSEIMKYLKSLINNHKTAVKELCDLLTDNTNKKLKTKSEKNIKPLESQIRFVLRSEDIEPRKFTESRRNNLLETEEQIKNYTEEFDQNIVILKEKLIKCKNENENFKGAISKINSDIQDIKKIFMNHKQMHCEETLQQIQTLKCGFLEVKNATEHTIKLVEKEIHTKEQLIHDLQKKINKIVEKNENTKLAEENRDNMIIMKDGNFKREENSLINSIEEFENDISKNKMDNSLVEMLTEHIQKIKFITGIQEERETIGNQEDTLIQERNILTCNNTKLIIKEQQSDGTVCEEKTKLTEDKMSQFNNKDGSDTNIKKIAEVQNWNFSLEDESGRSKSQNCSQERNIELAMTEEYRKEDKWKQLRTREHDSRRNIDLNTLCTETTVETCNNCENVNILKQKLKTEVSKLRNRYETRNISQ